MTNRFKVLSFIDDSITNKLTKFCWWTDTHYGKNNVWWAKITFAIIFPTLTAILEFFYEKNEKNIDFEVFFLVGFLFAWGFSYLFFSYFSVTQRVLRNAEKSPNKNKNDYYFIVFKIAIIINFLILWAFPHYPIIFGLRDNSNGFKFAIMISLELILYFLCTEPIPPAIKRKSLEELEKKGLQYIPQKN
jgi:hypothetical protein